MKYLALDIGNVLCEVNFTPVLQCISKNLNISLNDSMHFINRIQKLHDLGFTNISDELADHFKVHSEVVINEITHAWNTVISPNKQIISWLGELVSENDIKVALLSNIGTEHAKFLIDNVFIDYKLFNDVIYHFSCDVGARKPTLLYYQSFLQQYPEFKGCVYVDDLQENLDSSKKFGFKTFRLALDEIGESDIPFEVDKIKKLLL